MARSTRLLAAKVCALVMVPACLLWLIKGTAIAILAVLCVLLILILVEPTR